MKKLLFISLLFLSFYSDAQTVIARHNVDSFPLSTGGRTYGLTFLPPTYNATTRRYPLIIFLHGAGETGTTKSDLSKITNASPRSVAGHIAAGWNATVVNPLTGLRDTFIVISPQAATWSYNYSELKYILPNILSRYRVDTTRIYLTGLSAGGGGTYTTYGSRDSAFISKFAAMAVASSAGVNAANGYTDVQVEAGIRYGTQYGVRMWTICGEQDYLLTTGVRYHDSTNKPTVPAIKPNKLTVIVTVGHSAWGRGYDTLFRPTINYYGNTGNCNSGCNNGGVGVAPNANGSSVRGSGVTQDSLNMYEWFLTNQRSFGSPTAPTADAGLDPTPLYLPVDYTTLSGSGTAGTGYTISSYAWTHISGPATYTITSPSSASTTVTGLAIGTHVFRLTVTNSNSATATDDVTVVVNAANVPHVSPLMNAGIDQTITQPITTASVTGTRTLYDGATAVTTSWSKLKFTGQPTYSILAVGSSTAACYGVTTAECWRTKLSTYLKNGVGLIDTVYDLGINGGATIFGLNITTTLNTGSNPNKIIVLSYPSNGYDGSTYTTAQILNRFREVRDSIVNRGYGYVFMGTQPREDFATGDRTRLNVLNDSLALIFTDRFVNTMKIGKANATDLWKTEFSNGDGIHGNGAFHTEIANLIKAVNPFKYVVSSTASFSAASSLTTNITALAQGTHLFQVSTIDDYGHGGSDAVQITVNPSALPPIVNAGNDTTLTATTDSVILIGTAVAGSGTITGYEWTKIQGVNGTIIDPTNDTTVVRGLTSGSTYIFRFTVTNSNSLTAYDDKTVTTSAAPSTACSGVRYEADPFNNGGYWNDIVLLPGDTLDLKNKTFQYVALIDKHGLPGCPIVIINSGGVANIKGNTMADGDVSQLRLESCTYIKVTGTGSSDAYGIKIQPYKTDSLRNGSWAVAVFGKSKNIEIEKLRITNAGIGMSIKDEATWCDSTYDFPYWTIDSISIHHNYITKTWNQGMYIGNTSPDNAADSYSPRPVDCGGITTYPKPARMGNIKVYDNIVDSSGRGGIQVSSAMTGITEIYNNVVKHAGMNGDEQQGSAIITGAYTRAYIHHNTISNTLGYALAIMGGSGTGFTQRIEYNTIDSAGYLPHYDLWDYSRFEIKISTEPTYADVFTWPYSIFVASKPTENPLNDSTRFNITNNTVGIKKNTTDIGFADYRNTFHKTGNVVCDNTRSAGGAATAQNEEVSVPVYYSTSCGTPPPDVQPRRKFKIRIKKRN